MKYILTLLLFATLCSCKKEKITVDEPLKEDTIVVRKYYPDSKDISYGLVIKADITNSLVIARKEKNGSVRLFVSLGNGTPRSKDTVLYKDRLLRAKRLLKEVPKDFKTDSINSIGIGGLIETGDLAVAVSKQYFEKYGNPGNVRWHNPKRVQRIYDLIDNSQLSTDLDMLLAPYGKKTGRPTRLEQIIFVTKEVVKMYSNLETKDADIPERILDCGIDFEVVDK